MKRLTLTLTLLLFSLTFYGQYHGFQWVGNNNNLYKIEVSSSTLYKQTTQENWILIGKLNAESNIFNELPLAFDVNAFFNKNVYTITVSGTGQVFSLDLNSMSLRRLDNTYYRGYNFDATQFVRNDTLFSVGGVGFWHKHSLVTFYNSRNKEWDLLKTANENRSPSTFNFSGYAKKYDAFFSAYTLPDSVLANKAIPFLVFDFKTKKWTKKGLLTGEAYSFAKNRFRSVWTGEFLVCFYNEVLIVDPFNNKLYKFEKAPDKFFLDNAYVYCQNGKIYSRQLNTTVKGTKFILDSIPVSNIMKEAELIGKVYSTPTSNLFYLIVPITAIMLVVLSIVLVKVKRIKKTKHLNTLELKLLNKFLKSKKNELIPSSAINELLDLNDKSYDNQRQIRNRVINALNAKLFQLLGAKEFIKRASDDGDKRIMNYYINPDIKPKDLEKLVRIKTPA